MAGQFVACCATGSEIGTCGVGRPSEDNGERRPEEGRMSG